MAILVLALAYIIQSIIHIEFLPIMSRFILSIQLKAVRLWDIAVMYRSDADPRQVIYEIKKASGCDSVIKPGQVIKIPRG